MTKLVKLYDIPAVKRCEDFEQLAEFVHEDDERHGRLYREACAAAFGVDPWSLPEEIESDDDWGNILTLGRWMKERGYDVCDHNGALLPNAEYYAFVVLAIEKGVAKVDEDKKAAARSEDWAAALQKSASDFTKRRKSGG